MATEPLSAKKVVIIGGASGIGLAVAQAALAAGAKVVVGSSRQANVEAAVARLGDGAEGLTVDVTDEAAVAAFFERLGAFDHLVFTAGDWAGGFGSPLAQFDLAAAKTTLGVRFWGAIIAVKHAQAVIAKDGSITLTDGMLAHRPMKGAALATAMSGALEHLTRALAVELAPVRVNAVCPGLVLTDRNRAMPEAMVKRFTDGQPLARAAEPAEVAQAYLYAMRAGYTTGQVLMVDGGRWVV
jgi:NAD(P)-dependent dehydrogenase (short-subunit alcohol dehydrogenase family)